MTVRRIYSAACSLVPLTPFARHVFFFSCYCHHRDLHSFPTRRSSDLAASAKSILPSPLVSTTRKLKAMFVGRPAAPPTCWDGDRKSTRLNSSHLGISYAVFCLKKKKTTRPQSDAMEKLQSWNTKHRTS